MVRVRYQSSKQNIILIYYLQNNLLLLLARARAWATLALVDPGKVDNPTHLAKCLKILPVLGFGQLFDVL